MSVKGKNSTVQAVSYVEGTMKLSATKSRQKVATETLSSIQNEVLNEIVLKLLRNSDKTQVVVRMIDKPEYFVSCTAIDENWFHATFVNL